MKHQYLRAMGIDVWIPRDSVGAASPDGASRAMPEPDPVPEFDLCLVAYPGLGVVFENPGEEDFSRCKRLTDDLALALLGKASAGKLNRFQWPTGDDGEGSDPESVARQAVGELGPRVIAFGSPAGGFLGGRDNDVVSQGSQSIFLAPGLMDLMQTPLKKRDLWRALAEFRE